MENPVRPLKNFFQVGAMMLLMILLAASATAQQQATPPEQSPENSAKPADNTPNAPSSTKALARRECEEPEPTFTGLEYNGPLKKVVVHIVGKPEIRTVQHPRDRSGKPVCSLPAAKKFQLFAKDTFEPVTFIIAGFNAGLAQAQNDDPTFGQGAEGYGRRYGAAFADQVSGEFFGTFLYPTILREDPRYYRLGYGSKSKRLFHAMSHVVVTHTDSGKHRFNFSEWLGTSSTTALGNLYHPGNERGFRPAAEGVASSIGFDMGFDVLREFWPEVTQHLKLPFVSHTQAPPKK